MLKSSFEPIIPVEPSILILGSLPGDRSIAQIQYYAHPQNRFWKILFKHYQVPLSVDYTSRIALLHQYGIALWDICAQADRKGSMDTDINQVIPNPINKLLKTHPSIKRVIFNGQKSEKLYKKYFKHLPEVTYYSLPSTSPANAQFSLNTLQEIWSKALSINT